MDDPRSKYPKPPFKQQTQPWPGLACNMDPKPDHGETSYRGSGRLAGRKALITGGDSGMGRAAAIAYAREGADVAINYFPSEEPDAREVIQLIRAAGTSLGRPGQPAELASIYVQLAASDASFATGNIYGSGGGQGQP
jgi:NAD(P)-dependent dehydrogenase (short-subunit alcohol dehydrogenase family)